MQYLDPAFMEDNYHDDRWYTMLQRNRIRRNVKKEFWKPGRVMRLGSVMLVDFNILRLEIWRTKEEEDDGKHTYIVFYKVDGPMEMEEFGLTIEGVAIQWRILRECDTAERAIYTLEAKVLSWIEPVISASPWLRANWEYHLAPRLRAKVLRNLKMRSDK